MAGKTAQQPAVEEPVEGTPPGPQQADDQTLVPERLVEKIAEQSISAPSTNPAEADTMAPREPDLAEEQQPEVAQSVLADAMAHGKALVVVESAVTTTTMAFPRAIASASVLCANPGCCSSA